MNHKIVVSVITLFLLSLALLLFWQSGWMVSFLFLFIGYVRHRVDPIQHEFIWCLMAGFGGGVVEAVLVNFGHAWTYASPHFFGIPMYMPIFWGIVSAAVIALYEAVRS